MKALIWFFFNGLFWAAFVSGFFFDHDWARNVFLVFFWIQVVMAPLCLLPAPDPQALKRLARVTPSVPPLLSQFADLVLVAAMVHLGHLWLAAFWFFQMVCEAAVYKRAADLRAVGLR